MSAIQVFLLYINHSEFSWHIKQCPLLGRGPLLGASINGELTVCCLFCFYLSCLQILFWLQCYYPGGVSKLVSASGY